MPVTAATLVVYSAQLLVVVAAAALGAAVVRIAAPRARLALWQIVVASCLLLPLAPAQVERVPEVRPTATVSRGIVGPGAARDSTGSAQAADGRSGRAVPTRWTTSLPWLLASGVIVRLLWFGVGLIRLRGLRHESTWAALDEDLEALRTRVATRAEVRVHERLTQPVTFGLFTPLVLLPPDFRTLPRNAQRAVLAHELLHVARRDWLWLLAEEAVRAVFWFHPAMWFALAQIQLSREQVVDRAAVALTGERRTYMHALVSFVDGGLRVAPVIPFSRRRHLMSRIKQLSEEVTMSPARRLVHVVALCALIVASAVAVTRALPLRTTRPALPRAGVQAVNSSSTPQTPRTVVARAPAKFPAGMPDSIVGAYVTVRITVSPAGDVTAVEVTNRSMTMTKEFAAAANAAERAGMREAFYAQERTDNSGAAELLADAAKTAAFKWRFAPADTETTMSLAFAFAAKSGDDAVDAQPTGIVEGVASGVRGGVAGGVAGGVRGGVTGGVQGGASGSPSFGVSTTRPGELAQTPPPAKGPVRVGGATRPPRKVLDVKPMYPAEARAAHVAGVVILEIRIRTDGSVGDARILRSIPLLDDAAINAVLGWKFEPLLVDGEPTELLMTVTVNFMLDGDASTMSTYKSPVRAGGKTTQGRSR